MRNTRKLYGLLLLIFAMGLATAATTPVAAQKEVPTLTYELRTDAKFKDGTTLTAADVKWTFDRVVMGWGEAAFLLEDMIHSIEVVDDRHVKIILLDDFAFFEPVLSSAIGGIVKKDSAPVDAGADGVDGTISWGTGPYRLISEVRDVETVFERNPDYWGPKPKNAKVTITYYASNALLAAALEAGDIDVAGRHIDATKMKDWNENVEDNLETLMLAGGVMRYIIFPNETLYPRITQGIRQAISYAVDRDAICTAVFGGTSVPAYTMVMSGYLGHLPAFPLRDLAKAKELLTAEGYSKANPFEIELWYSPTHYGTEESSVAAVVKAALEETGMMQVTLQFVEWAEYKEKWGATEMEMYLLGWYPDYIDTDTYLYPFYHSSGASWGPKPDPVNYALDRLLYDARTTFGAEERIALYEQAQKIMAEEVKVLPLFSGVQFAAWQKDTVSDIVLGPDTEMRFHDIQKGPTTDGELRVGTTDKIISLDYLDTYDHWSWLMSRHTTDKLVQYKAGTAEIEYMLATGPPEMDRTVVGIETVVTTMPITTVITTVVSEFNSIILVSGGTLGLSVALRVLRKKRN